MPKVEGDAVEVERPVLVAMDVADQNEVTGQPLRRPRRAA
jgi:hypothetical protein